MFLDVRASDVEAIAIIDRMNVATTAHVDAIYGARIAAVNGWVCIHDNFYSKKCIHII